MTLKQKNYFFFPFVSKPLYLGGPPTPLKYYVQIGTERLNFTEIKPFDNIFWGI